MKYFRRKIIVKALVEVGFIGSFPYAQGTICSLIAALFGFYINIKLGSEITLIFVSLNKELKAEII